jgi:hypothetical protein
MRELILVVFPSRSALTKALDQLFEAEQSPQTRAAIGIVHAAIVDRASDGEVMVVNDRLSADEGGLAGGTLGAAMAMLGVAQLGALAIPGIGAIIAVGASGVVGALVGGLTGRVAARFIETLPEGADLQPLAERLKVGQPALALQVRDGQSALAQLRTVLAPYQVVSLERVRLSD